MSADIGLIRSLVELCNEFPIAELTVEEGDFRVTLCKHRGTQLSRQEMDPVPSETPVDDGGQPLEPSLETSVNLVSVAATVVGVLHLGREPEGRPLVRLGDSVRVGQAVCFIESMKILNEVHCPSPGRIAQVLVEDGHPVEYGQILMMIEAD